jgi:Fe-S-cluster containining protein
MVNSCKNCGACCTLFLVNLSRNEYASGRYQTQLQEHGVIKNFAHAQRCGAHLVAKNADDSCIYRVDNRCRIHAARPQVCRDFFCTSRAKKFAGMVKAIQANATPSLGA